MKKSTSFVNTVLNPEIISENQIVETSLPTKKKKQIENVEQLVSFNLGLKDTIYIYPINVKGNPKSEKSFRTKLRNTLEGFVNIVHVELNIKKNKEFNGKELVDKFLGFYKGNYRTNDFTILSLRQTISEDGRVELQFFLNWIKTQIVE